MGLTTSATQRQPGTERSRWRTSAFAAVWWALSFGLTLATYPFINDHFGRISAARQIAQYGELPFRDFLDPGYVLTELVSAGVQRLFGDNLIGEILWTSSCIATGALLVILLTRRLAPSRLSGLLIGILVILAAPRPYDFDKFLFYPLGILLCWRYTNRPDSHRLWALAGSAVIAGMFRYDNGLFALAAGLVTILVLHARDLKTTARHASLLIVASVVCAMPYLVFLQLNGGIANAAGQMLTYARREGARTRLTSLPLLVPPEIRVVHNPDRVQVRWSEDAERSRLETHYTLHGGIVRGDPAQRIWLYEIDDASRKNLRALIDDPHVADTHLVDRATALLTPEDARAIPLTASWAPEDAANSLYWIFLLMPAAAAAMVWRRGAADSAERARVLSAVTVAVCVIGFVLREPLVARMSGAAAPTIVLGTWLWGRVHSTWAARLLGAGVLVTTAVVSGWGTTVVRLSENALTFPDRLGQATTSPPSPLFLPATPVSGAIGYVRRCTMPDDRVFAGWFVPELYFFSQRAFAGGVVAMFGHHWSESASQRRILAKLASESVPIVILPNDNRDFQETYLELDAYFRAHYRSVGPTRFGRAEGVSYLVLTRNDRVPTGTDPITSLPCFGDRQ